MYLCRRCEAGRSQSPPRRRGAARTFAAAAAHFPSRSGKFAWRADGLIGSLVSPSQRLGAGGSRAVAAPLWAPRAAPSRPRPPAPGRARHVLPAVWIPVFVGTPGEGPPSGPRGTPPDSPARGLPATRGGFPAVRARATRPSHAARRGQEPGKATGAGRDPRSPLCLLLAPARDSEAAPREGPGPGRTVAPERPLGGAWTLRARAGAPSREALGGEAALGPGPPRGCPPSPRSPPQFLMTTNALSTCCESGGRTLADSGPAASAQAPVYCPVYESRLLATARHELNSAAALGVYGGPYGGSQGYGNYVTYGSEASAFYSLVRAGSACQACPTRRALTLGLSDSLFPTVAYRGGGRTPRPTSWPGPSEHRLALGPGPGLLTQPGGCWEPAVHPAARARLSPHAPAHSSQPSSCLRSLADPQLLFAPSSLPLLVLTQQGHSPPSSAVPAPRPSPLQSHPFFHTASPPTSLVPL